MNKPNRCLWILVFVFFFLGDILTTLVGVSSDSMTESSLIYKPILETYGLYFMVFILTIVKVVVTGICFKAWDWWDSEIMRYSIPLALVVTGVIATVWNGFLIGVYLL